MRNYINIIESGEGLPAPNVKPFWITSLMPLTADLKRTWGRDWSWVSGGCFAFAEVFQSVFGGELYGICTEVTESGETDYPVEHALVKLNGAFYDFNGVADIDAQISEIKQWKLKQGVDLPVSLKSRDDDYVFWFEDEYLDDEEMKFLKSVLAGKITAR